MNDELVSNSTPDGNSCSVPICPPNVAAAAYTFLQHIGFILDELCTQGLVIWLDDNDRWQWRWQGTELKSVRGFWMMGEAMVDGVNGRFPQTFSIPNIFDESK